MNGKAFHIQCVWFQHHATTVENDGGSFALLQDAEDDAAFSTVAESILSAENVRGAGMTLKHG